MKPFGPVDNGTQYLYGLDYRMAPWRTNIVEENPFHTEVDHEVYGILQGKYLAEKARTKKYALTVTIDGDTWSYDECTSYDHAIGGTIAHTDRNALKRVAD